MRLFIMGLPHTKTLDPATSPFMTCAYTTKVWNLCRMMHERGHEVIHLGVEGSNPPCMKHVDVQSDSAWRGLYGSRQREDFYDVGTEGRYAKYMEDFSASCLAAVLISAANL